MIERVFQSAALRKYPEGPLLSRQAFRYDLYVCFGRAIETNLLAEKSLSDVVVYCVALKLAGPGGVAFTVDEAGKVARDLVAAEEVAA